MKYMQAAFKTTPPMQNLESPSPWRTAALVAGVTLAFANVAGEVHASPNFWVDRVIWPLFCALSAGVFYVFGANSHRDRLAWIQGQGEAGWQKNIQQLRARKLKRVLWVAILTWPILWLSGGHPNPKETAILCTGLFIAIALLTRKRLFDLEQNLVRQRDLALQARLAPHFLHGALSTLKGQIEADPLEAQAMVDHLAKLSREATAMTAEQVVPLSRELAFVEAYLGVERMHHGPRLKVCIEVPEALETEPVPPMLLQLLVENALRHGLPVEGGEIRIEASRLPEGLQLCVEDPGRGTHTPGLGLSLGILQRRLENASDLRLESTPEGRYQATLLLRRP